MKNYFTKLLCFVAAVTIAGCGSVQVSDVPPPASSKVLSEYKIGVGDQLQINVWKNEELSSEVPVRPDGKISLPLVGDISAQGLSALQLAENITTGLKTYIRSPQVNVTVLDAGSVDYLLRVRVTGAVSTPRSIPHRDGMTVLDLVLEAGGPTEFASGNRAKLYRKVDGEVKTYPIRLNDILKKGRLQTNYTLAPSDIVIVPERLL